MPSCAILTCRKQSKTSNVTHGNISFHRLTMGSMLRSEQMTFCDIYIQPEAAFEILSQLGEMGCVQFLDLNEELQLFQRSYVTEVCRFAEMERKLRYFLTEMKKEKMKIPFVKNEPPAMHPNEMFGFENLFDKWEDDISQMTSNQASLVKSYMELLEMAYVLSSIGPLLGEDNLIGKGKLSGTAELLRGGHLDIVTGVVRRSRCFPFEMMLWRISRGNIYYRQAKDDKIVQDPATGQDIRKVAFLAVCQGEALSSHTQKVCSGFRVNVYPCPKNYDERIELVNKIETRSTDLEQVLKKTKYHRCKALQVIAKQWYHWAIQVKKSKAIYHNLNRFNFDITKKCLIGQCWVPNRDLKRVQQCLENISKNVGTNVPSFMSRTETKLVPPTYHRTNKFTHGFQALIDAYGASSYRELNPGLYTIITFPFLFSMMFADLGHGFIVLLSALWMLKNEKKFLEERSDNEIWNIFFGGRYVILMLGLFSMFAGFVYNDIFSKSFNFGNSWLSHIPTMNIKNSDLTDQDFYFLELNNSVPYPYGVDPIWPLTGNKIMLENSIKMKLSIIIGIVHMMFGIILSVFNYIYFKQYYKIFLQFIPEILFLLSLFMWLVFLIYYKWFVYGAKKDGVRRAACAPLILVHFINMLLLRRAAPPDDNCNYGLLPSIDMQNIIESILLFIAAGSIPVLLLGSPIYLAIVNRKKQKHTVKQNTNFRRYQDSDNKLAENKIAEEEEDSHTHSFSDIMIHQSIHTIEYILSTVSHTASYLRLWALSLAHTELSEMLWSMILSKLALSDHSKIGPIKLFFVFPIWAFFTISILVVMEGLSAFLHTLRLHWVEFMSKFFIGGGWLFKPFSFSGILDEEDDKAEGACKKKVKKMEDKDV